ncbi:hypothetical protein SAICODRAFT_20254 [Saitoella complicata NRRL Y-17804]|uniref:Maintenance of mitochondrial morphology protein 1 n=1 Tax=Saitoella complicata (strain BCRC 22490 / CBS 7301 / JCM 7358 / NBRC 10748 / NRRL Y-17804) TaxID=698492 RepID=A0A0E9NGY8_SAICN|nr:uncharacterized protein SAICODRAFT_20254 [Saitoella complicata NRRL Y-17804]ODQ51936.1 hypothetical protein SAICODRAFT_20254 [Saitoella complicata NRRL Y-17804]GAO48675.1 hypothetical protein G7K_2845-t1 [Saitoella complicata NRRL Y-17804]
MWGRSNTVTIVEKAVSTAVPDLPAPVLEYVSRLSSQHVDSRWSFTQGFLLGQFTVIGMVCVFLWVFILGDKDTVLVENARGQYRRNQLRKKKSSVLRNTPVQSTSEILAKTFYNVASHQPESLDWFNVLVAQAVMQFREDAKSKDAILTSLDAVMNGPRKPDFLSDIRITELSLGEEFPIFSNCRIRPMEGEPNRLRAEMDIDLRDQITLAIETKFLLNYPKPLFAVLPVALGVSITRFSATLSVSFVPPPDPDTSSSTTTLTFSFSPDFRLDINVRSLLGARSRLQDIPKIAQIIEKRLRDWFMDRCVQPHFQQVAIPSLWPSKAKEGHVQKERSTQMEAGANLHSSEELLAPPASPGVETASTAEGLHQRTNLMTGANGNGNAVGSVVSRMPGAIPGEAL